MKKMFDDYEDYALLYSKKENYVSPFFFYDEDELKGIAEVRFYPDMDSRLYIKENGDTFYTD